MKRFLIFLGLLISVSMNSQVTEKNFIDQNYIETTGTVETEVLPDIFYAVLTIRNPYISTNKTYFFVQEENLKRELAGAGMDVKNDFRHMEFNSMVESNSTGSNPEKYKKYYLIIRNDNIITFIKKNFDKLKLYKFDIQSYSCSEIDKTELDLSKKAIELAYEKAEILAKVSNQTIGKALMVMEIADRNPKEGTESRLYKHNSTFFARFELKPNFSPIKIKKSVLVRFELK